jgi:hypothetical protein
MDKNLVVIFLILILLVAGMFAYSQLDQIGLASAETRIQTTLDREPAAVQAATDISMTLAVKVLAGVVATLLLTGGVLLYKQAELNQLKAGSWGRFWERRRPSRPARQPKPASLTDLVTLMVAKDLTRRDR